MGALNNVCGGTHLSPACPPVSSASCSLTCVSLCVTVCASTCLLSAITPHRPWPPLSSPECAASKICTQVSLSLSQGKASGLYTVALCLREVCSVFLPPREPLAGFRWHHTATAQCPKPSKSSSPSTRHQSAKFQSPASLLCPTQVFLLQVGFTRIYSSVMGT